MQPPAPPRTHPLAAAALAAALLAAGLALYGSFLSEVHLAGSRLNEARNAPGAAFTRDSKAVRVWVQVAAYFLPFALGVGAAVAGGEAMKAIERTGGAGGHLPAVFAVMVGGLAAVVSGCMLVAVYGWQYVPAWTS
jgi:hypothetical protein